MANEKAAGGICRAKAAQKYGFLPRQLHVSDGFAASFKPQTDIIPPECLIGLPVAGIGAQSSS